MDDKSGDGVQDTAERTQVTLGGDPAQPRKKPGTLLYCDACDDVVLRGNRFSHEHDLSLAPEAADAVQEEIREQFELPVEDIQETQQYEVEFRYEYRERVVVEASHASEAKEAAKRKQEYAHNGELVQTLHTEKRPLGDPSAPTLDYLEEYRLLEDDHNVTQTDVERVFDDE